MHIPQVIQILCIGSILLALSGVVLRQVLKRRSRQNDPFRYLRGKSPEEIRQILLTPVYTDPPSKPSSRSKRKTKRTD